jgi:hypothetical protein
MRTLFLTCAALLLAACETSPRPPVTMPDRDQPPLRLAVPDRSYRIDPADRARLRASIDPDALERFLGMVHPHYRAQILSTFIVRPPSQGWMLFNRVPDPALQQALDEVWAPRRRLETPELLARVEAHRRVRQVPFLVAVVPALDAPGASAIVVHAGSGNDRVLLREGTATATLLASATERLMRSRLEHGLQPDSPRRIVLSPADDDWSGTPESLLPNQQALLTQLSHAPMRDVEGIGPARAAEFREFVSSADQPR